MLPWKLVNNSGEMLSPVLINPHRISSADMHIHPSQETAGAEPHYPARDAGVANRDFTGRNPQSHWKDEAALNRTPGGFRNFGPHFPPSPPSVSPLEQSGERRKVLLTFTWRTPRLQKRHSAPAGTLSRSTPPGSDHGAAEPAKGQRRHASFSIIRQLMRGRAETHPGLCTIADARKDARHLDGPPFRESW